MKFNDVLFLMNPKSNEGNSKKEWYKMQKDHPDLPNNPYAITEIKNLSGFIEEKHPVVVAVAGGDGTINSVVRSILPLKKKPAILVLPFGFGNAISYCLGTETMDKALYVLTHRPQTELLDVMATTNTDFPIGVFNISAGFDAHIVHKRMHERYIGYRSYFLSAVKGFVEHKNKHMTITIDDTVTIEATASSLMIAKCPIIGKNIVAAPNARLNDGYLDCTLFSTRFHYIANLRLKGFKHPLYTKEGKVHFKAKKIAIAGEPFVQVDGDPIINKSTIEISIVPHAVPFLVNEEKHILQSYTPFV